MIVRFGGGNSGIAEYLEKGRKADRDYSREELDHRLILDGDLSLTESVINAIEDKGQERYLHITLSFHETEVSSETLHSVTQEYKSLLMSAYHTDEYSFYAEAHLPKLSHMADNRTGELVERKPHIHIVLPRVNLVTEKSLNPIGDATNKITQERLDAIQEHINNKYGLASPKDGVRVSDENHASVLSRAKGDLFREKNNKHKNEIFRRLDKDSIRSMPALKTMLSEFGEVKTRNEGKPGEYLAVKFSGDSKFTNFKSPLFSKSYIEERRIPLVKPSESQIASRLDSWKNQTSHEIKHVFSKGEKLREHYKSLNQKEKIDFLQERIGKYERDNKLNAKNSSRKGGRQSSNKSGVTQPSRIHRTETGIGLPRMSSRQMVYGIPGRERAEAFSADSLLSRQSRGDVAESQEKRKYSGEELRRAYDGRDRGRVRLGETSVADSSPVVDMYLRHIDRNSELSESEHFSHIKRDIDPARFLSYLKDRFNIKPGEHKITFAEDGSPRFRCDKRNLNASDFLTKKMNLNWEEAKIVLTDVYSQQLSNKHFEKIDTSNNKMSDADSLSRRQSLAESRNEIRAWVRSERKELFAQIKEMRSQLRDISPKQRSLAEGVIVFTKLTGLEKIKEAEKEARNSISRYHSHWSERSSNMQALDKLKTALNLDDDNGIKPDVPKHNLQHAVESQVRVDEMRNNNQQLKDLVMDKGRFGVDYRDMKTQSVVFSDKGNHVVAGKNPTDKEIGLMLEYAKEKYGGVLKLTGTDEFKTRCATAAAESGMNVILKPEKYHDLMLNTRQELDLQKTNAVQQTATEATSPAPAVAEPADNGVQQVSKEQLRATVEALPERVSPSQLKEALAGMALKTETSAASPADQPAVPLEKPAATASAFDTAISPETPQELNRDQLRAVVESLPEVVSPSELRNALEAAAATAAPEQTTPAAATPEAPRAVSVEDLPEMDVATREVVPAAPETAPEATLKAAIESLPETVSPNELKDTVDAVNQQHNAVVSLQEIQKISPESVSAVNASILAQDALPGTAGVLRDIENNTYDVLIASRDDDVYRIATVESNEQATRLAMLVNNQEPIYLASAIRDELAAQHTQSEQATKFGLNAQEASAMAAVAQINKDMPDANINPATLRDFHAGSFTAVAVDPFSNSTRYEVVGATKDELLGAQAGDVRITEVSSAEQAQAIRYELNGVNTDALAAALDKQASYEALTSYDQLKNGIRDADFADSLPEGIDQDNVQYKEIAPNTWSIEVPDATGEGHIIMSGFKGNEDYARAVVDKVTRIDLTALSHGLEHRANEQQSAAQHQVNEVKATQAQEAPKPTDHGME